MVAPTLERDDLKSALGDISFPIQIIKENPLDMIRLSDIILVASGTATLMVGLMEKPMVIMYRMNPVTAWFAKRLVTKTKFFGLPNLIMDETVVPELFQEQANPTRLALELERFIQDPALRTRTVTSLGRLKARLGERGATVKIARILDEYLR